MKNFRTLIIGNDALFSIEVFWKLDEYYLTIGFCAFHKAIYFEFIKLN